MIEEPWEEPTTPSMDAQHSNSFTWLSFLISLSVVIVLLLFILVFLFMSSWFVEPACFMVFLDILSLNE